MSPNITTTRNKYILYLLIYSKLVKNSFRKSIMLIKKMERRWKYASINAIKL